MLSDSIVPIGDHVCESPWYALYIRHQHEKTVAQILTHKGFKTFLPLYVTAHNWKDRTKTLSLPLFPCYVFLKGGLERRIQIIATPGIYGIVSNGGQPAVIPDMEIEAIRRVVESGARVEAHAYLKYGDRVRIKSGPLEGVQGIFVRKKNISRLVLSVEILGRAVAIEISALQIESANAGRLRDYRVGHGTGSGHTSNHGDIALA